MLTNIIKKYIPVSFKILLKKLIIIVSANIQYLLSHFEKNDISIYHNFMPPPNGGGNQFLSALRLEFESRGLRVENNKISKTTKLCIINSYNFDFYRLKRFSKSNCFIVHRVDGPLSVYRNTGIENDAYINSINRKYANVTAFQSSYSMEKHRELGMSFNNPQIINNAVDPSVFNMDNKSSFNKEKIRIISTSWSDNMNKGFDIYKWVGENINWKKYEYTFIGRTPIDLGQIIVKPPTSSNLVAQQLKLNDIYIMASKYESCPNSVIEALACGLPVVYLDSGATAEIVKNGGVGFRKKEEIIDTINLVVDNYRYYQLQIKTRSISEISDMYLKYYTKDEMV